jgi:hypothetical protein
MLSILPRTTTPDVPTGNLPFDREAFLARAATLKGIVATGQFPQERDTPPIQQPLQMEWHLRLLNP